jgi:hypothetical protein
MCIDDGKEILGASDYLTHIQQKHVSQHKEPLRQFGKRQESTHRSSVIFVLIGREGEVWHPLFIVHVRHGCGGVGCWCCCCGGWLRSHKLSSQGSAPKFAGDKRRAELDR